MEPTVLQRVSLHKNMNVCLPIFTVLQACESGSLTSEECRGTLEKIGLLASLRAGLAGSPCWLGLGPGPSLGLDRAARFAKSIKRSGNLFFDGF